MSIEVEEEKLKSAINRGPYIFSLEHRKYPGLRPNMLAKSLDDALKQLRWKKENCILTGVELSLDILDEYAKSVGLIKIAETPGMGAYIKREYAFT